MVSLTGVGAAFPSLRLARTEIATAWGDAAAKGSLPVCADDEDALTLAWQAADRALTAAQAAPDSIEALVWGTTRPPFAEGPSHALLAAALSLPSNATGYLLSGSAHAGIEALLAGADLVAAGSARRVLVVTSDDPRPALGTGWERQAAAGAAAVVLEAGDAGPAVLGARHTRSEPVLDRYRGVDDEISRDIYDPRLYREQIFLPFVADVAGQLPGVTAWSLPAPDARLGSALARRLGTEAPEASPGDLGAAAALTGAVPALAGAGTVGVVGYGGGRTTGVAVTVQEAVPGAGPLSPLLEAGRATSYAQVLRNRRVLGASAEPMPMGLPPGSAAFVRGGREMLGLLGARCADCGTVSTPPSVHPRCLACGGEKTTEVTLARTGTVHTYVVNHTMPAPFVAPLPLAVLDLDDGARLMLQVTGGHPDIEIGDRVRLVLRRYAVERGASVYGYKALPEPTKGA